MCLMPGTARHGTAQPQPFILLGSALRQARAGARSQIQLDALDFARQLQRRNAWIVKYAIGPGVVLGLCAYITGLMTAVDALVGLCTGLVVGYCVTYAFAYIAHRWQTWRCPNRINIDLSPLYVWPPPIPSPRECNRLFDAVLQTHLPWLDVLIGDPVEVLADTTYDLFRLERSLHAGGNCLDTLTVSADHLHLRYEVTYKRNVRC